MASFGVQQFIRHSTLCVRACVYAYVRECVYERASLASLASNAKVHLDYKQILWTTKFLIAMTFIDVDQQAHKTTGACFILQCT